MRLYSIMIDLCHESGYLTLDYFSQKYKVSARTIQDDFAILRKAANRNGFLIKSRKGVGYLLEVLDQKELDHFLLELQSEPFTASQDRPSQILSYLAAAKGYTTLDKLAKEFSISRAQMKQDIKKVSALAARENIQLYGRSHYGILLRGEPKYIHQFLARQYLHDDPIILKNINQKIGSFDEMRILFARQLSKESLDINYNELVNVLTYFKVFVYTANATEEKAVSYHFGGEHPLNRVAYTMTKALENQYKVCFTDEVRREIMTVLLHNVRIQDGHSYKLNNLENDIDDFLKITDHENGTDYFNDLVFKKLLAQHVSLLLDRLNNKISYQNPLAVELNITDPISFDVAIRFCNMLHQNYGVQATFDEIGFIAAHFAAHTERVSQRKLETYNRIAVVCSSGGGIAYMLQMQIQPLFRDAELKTFSFLQFDDLIAFHPNLIFTVVPLPIQIDVPVIYIRELLDTTDLMRIREILQGNVTNPYILMKSNEITDSLFKRELFTIEQDENYEHLIREMALRLEKLHYGNQGYSNLVMEREKYVSTVYMNGVCIPHPIETEALQSAISVAVMQKPYQWNNKTVRIIFMICLRKEQVELYKKITKRLYTLMQNKRVVDRLAAVHSYEEMMAIMKEMEVGENE